VPEPLQTADGARRVGGLTVSSGLDGVAPSSGNDWDLVVAELGRLHRVTLGWPQRPGSVSAGDLLELDAGGDIDLATMPADAVRACRRAWAAIPEGERLPVVHGDPSASNLRICEGRVGMLDWDESRVDHPWFDLADVPTHPLGRVEGERASQAAHAWEAAAGWNIEPDYARCRLAQLRP
jgi:Ser/Thr protein kinase RdoA (MazF antagonist)